MNHHEEYRELLSALLDGELDGEARERTLAHLEECEDCRAYFAELTALHGAFAGLADEEPPAALYEGVRARLHEKPEKKENAPKKRYPRRAWAALAACAAVVVLAVTVSPGFRLGRADSKSAAAETPAAPMQSMTTANDADAPAENEEANVYLSDEALRAELHAVPGTQAAAAVGDSAAAPVEPTPESGAAEGGSTIPAGDNGVALNTADPAAKGEANAAEEREPDLLLYGENAEYWLWTNGAWDEERQAYWVDRDTLAVLPEGLRLGTEEMLLAWQQSDVYIALVRAADAEAGQ